MKILLAVPEYPPHHIGGGAEAYMQLARHYTQFGHTVTVAYGYYPNKSLFSGITESESEGVYFLQIPEIPYPRSKPFLRTAMPMTSRAKSLLIKHIQSTKYDVAHLHGYGWPFTNSVASMCNKYKIPYLFTIHGYPESQNKNFLYKKIWSLFIERQTRFTLQNAKKITCVSDYIRQDLRNICQEKSHTIYAGIDASQFKENRADIDIRTLHSILKEETVIYSLGRISEMKGFQEIIKLLPLLKRRGIIAKYIIAGDDEGYKSTLKSLAKKLNVSDSVIFTGFHNHETKIQYIQQCDFFGIPSLREPFGLVALEGASLNKPILTTDIGGLKEILQSYPNKLNVYDTDIVERIISFNVSPSRFDLSRFSWQKISEQYLHLLKSILGEETPTT